MKCSFLSLAPRAFAAPAALLVLLFGLPGAVAAQAPPDSTETTLTYLQAHPGDYSLVAFTARADGSIDPAGPALSIRPNERIPLGPTFKIVVLAAYARAVAAGRLDPQEGLTLSQWEGYYLPGTDGGAHALALQGLGIPVTPEGFAADPAARATLDDLANAVLRRHLDVPLPNNAIFRVLGQKGGALAGVLTAATYGIPSTGELAGASRVAVLFLHRVPERDWTPMLATGAPLFFAFRPDRDADFARRVRAVLVPQAP